MRAPSPVRCDRHVSLPRKAEIRGATGCRPRNVEEVSAVRRIRAPAEIEQGPQPKQEILSFLCNKPKLFESILYLLFLNTDTTGFVGQLNRSILLERHNESKVKSLI